MYDYKLSKKLDKIIYKLLKKDKKLYNQVLNKINEIINSNNVENYKNLRYNLKKYKRAHISHFVLIFKYDKEKNLILFEDFNHHDIVYKLI